MFKKCSKNKSGGRNEKDSLRSFVITLLMLASALIFLVLYTFFSFYSISRADSISVGSKTVNEVSEKINNFLLKGFNVLSVTCNTVDFMVGNGAPDGTIEKYIRSMTMANLSSESGSFLNIHGIVNGKFVNGLKENVPEHYFSKNDDWFISAVRAGGKPVISSPYIDPVSHSLIVSVSRLLSDYSSVICIDISMKAIQEIARDISMNDRGVGFILDKSSLIITHRDPSLIGRHVLKDANVDENFRALVGRIIESSKKTTESGVHFDVMLGEERSIVFSSQVDISNWYVVIVVPYSELFGKLLESIVLNAIGIVIIIYLVLYSCIVSYNKRKRLEKEVEAKNAESIEQSNKLISMQTCVIEGMATLIEERDGNTGEHIKNTKVYSQWIAEMLYLKRMFPGIVTKDFVKNICDSAPLHDIGKITVPDKILLKDSKLDPIEMEVMRQHTIQGGMIIRKIFKDVVDKDAFQMALDVAMFHHERWDGKGYPSNLVGSNIPLSARILAVADCFDALVSRRVYKPSIPAEKAFLMIADEAGTHFDPDIVDVFMHLKPKIESYLEHRAQEERRKMESRQSMNASSSDEPAETVEELEEV